MAELLRLRNVSVEMNGKSLLRNISFSIATGEFICVVGPNGAGKSTLLRAAHGLIAPTIGDRLFAPQVLTLRQAMIFQRPVMLRRSVIEHAMFVLGHHDAAYAALESAQLTHATTQSARALSGGEQQRLSLALAAARSPKILFADEPTASLDIHAGPAVEDALRALYSTGTAILMATHSLAQVKRLATRVIFMHQGEITDDCTVAHFFTGNLSPLATTFLDGERL